MKKYTFKLTDEQACYAEALAEELRTSAGVLLPALGLACVNMLTHISESRVDYINQAIRDFGDRGHLPDLPASAISDIGQLGSDPKELMAASAPTT